MEGGGAYGEKEHPRPRGQPVQMPRSRDGVGCSRTSQEAGVMECLERQQGARYKRLCMPEDFTSDSGARELLGFMDRGRTVSW